MHCKSAALVINPRSGENLAKIAAVLAVLNAAGWRTRIGIKEYGRHSMGLAKLASQEKSDLVIAYGGDGTLGQVINGVMKSKKRKSVVGILPGGTANVWAGEIGVPIDPVKAALTLVSSKVRKVDIGHVAIEEITFPEGDPGQCKKSKSGKKKNRVKSHFLLMAGLGIDAAIMGGVSKPLKHRLGPLAVGLSAAGKVSEHRAFPIEIHAASGDQGASVTWQGEALQIVIGNTRRYADVTEMTPDAYIDDGILDICVITGGNPLTTLQQISSLILRKKPDTLTAEYFHGRSFSIRVPATIPMQLDGSAVKLKDYLSKADYDTLMQTRDREQVMITYRFEALPRALKLAVPRTYDNTLFKGSNGYQEQDTAHTIIGSEERNKVAFRADPTADEAIKQTEQQEQTEEEMTHRQNHGGEANSVEDVPGANPELAAEILEEGRRVTILAYMLDAGRKRTSIVAGTTPKPSTGEAKPVAVVIDKDTDFYNMQGEHLSSSALDGLQAGRELAVKGKKNRRGVIKARQIVL